MGKIGMVRFFFCWVYLYFNDCVRLIVRLHIQTHVKNIQMARQTKADKMIVFGRH